MYSTLLFDLDGTLIDSAEDIAASVNHTRRHFGVEPLPLAQVKAAVGDGLVTLLERTVPAPTDASKRVYWVHHAEHCLDRTTVYAGVREGLEHLSGKVQLGVVTNKPQAFSQQILAGLGIVQHFGVIVGGDTAAGRKPDPGPVLAANAQLGTPPWSTLMIGDSLGDLQAGRAAGTASCAVGWGFRPIDSLRAGNPDHEVLSFAELINLLQLRDGRPRTVFDQVGREGCFALARAFYARIDRDPRLRAMFPPFLDQSIEHQALFLIQLFGGPSDYGRLRGPARLRMRHGPFAIDAAARDAWLENMFAAMTEVALPEPAAGILRRYFTHTGSFLINR